MERLTSSELSLREHADSQLNNADYKRYLSPTYDKSILFKRALTVFHLNFYGESFEPGARGISSDNEAKNVDVRRDFVMLMGAVFEQKVKTGLKSIEEYFEQIDQDISDNEWQVTVSVEECRTNGTRKLFDPSLIIHDNIGSVAREIQLKGKKSLFWSRPIKFSIKMKQIHSILSSNKEMIIAFRTQNLHREDEIMCNKLTIKYTDIFPGGYRQWFTFENGLECLISVQFSLKDFFENHRTAVHEHTQFLWHMFKYRYKLHFRNDPHDDAPLDHKNLDDSIGDIDLDIVLRNFVHASTTGHMTDISADIVVKDDDAIDVSVGRTFCHCSSEWCNIRTFFSHNGWFGLIVQRFVQFFVRGDFNLAPSYILSLSHLLHYYSQHRFSTYLLNLLNSSLVYMRIFYSINLRFPSIDLCSYKFIRNIDLARIVELRPNSVMEPFNPTAVSAVLNYCQLFDYLHTHIARMDVIVPSRFVDNWFDGLYERTYKYYNSFMMEHASRGFKNTNTQVYEMELFDQQKYNNKFWIQDTNNEQTSEERNKIFASMGVSFGVHSHVNIIYKICNFIGDTYDDLPDGDKQKERCDFAVHFDEFLTNSMFQDVPTSLKVATLNALPQNVSSEHRDRFLRFFVLKLYSIAFKIQRYITYPLSVYRSCSFTPPLLIVDLKFAFQNDWIERIYEEFFPDHELFSNHNRRLQELITEFYSNEWPFSSEYEADSHVKPLLVMYSNIIMWWKLPSSHHAKVKFEKIIDCHFLNVESITERVISIFEREYQKTKLPPKVFASLDQNILARDQAAIYMVQAACFSLSKVAMSTTRILYKLYTQCESDAMLFLTRPGALDLIDTVNITLKQLQELKHVFMKYDDHCNTIGRALENTRQLVSSMYKDFYWRVFSDWYTQTEETISILSKRSKSENQIPWAILTLSLAIGQHFTVHFHQPFRKDFIYFRKKFTKIEKRLEKIARFNLSLYHKRKNDIINLQENTDSTKFNLPDLEEEIFNALRLDVNQLNAASYISQCKV